MTLLATFPSACQFLFIVTYLLHLHSLDSEVTSLQSFNQKDLQNCIQKSHKNLFVVRLVLLLYSQDKFRDLIIPYILGYTF